MKFKEAGTIKNKKGIIGKRFDTDAPISIDSMIEILKRYENENTKLFECRCSTFTESGNPVGRIYKSVDSLRKLHNSPNPSVSVIAIFIDPKNDNYKFTISMAANTRGMNYYVSDRGALYVEKTIELDRMEMEAEKKRNAQLNDDATYRK